MSIISSETKSHGEGQGHYSGILFRVLFLETLNVPYYNTMNLNDKPNPHPYYDILNNNNSYAIVSNENGKCTKIAGIKSC